MSFTEEWEYKEEKPRSGEVITDKRRIYLHFYYNDQKATDDKVRFNAMLDRYIHKEWLYYLILLISALPGVFYVRTTDYFTALGCLIDAVAAFSFERRYVNYEDTRRIPTMILRVLGAVVIYLVVNSLLKMPFDKEFLAGTSLATFLIRTARYAIIMFLIMGVYPIMFPLFEKVGKKA
ncbi:MAG: hypothetical protein K6E10_09785 [Eubacterium sp.]|nr:hypothetical protein [Eubacterium sp.]